MTKYPLLKKNVIKSFVFTFALGLAVQEVQAVPEAKWQLAGWCGGGAYPAIVPDPNNYGKVYLLSDVNGVWVSDNKGDQWNFRTQGLANLNTASLAISNSNPNVLYNGTQRGMHRSEDSGQTWTFLTSTNPSIQFSRPGNYKAIVIDRNDPYQVYAANKSGEVFFSSNGGSTWTRVGTEVYPMGASGTISVLYLSRDSNFLFAGSSRGLMRFDKSRGVWEKMNVGTVGVYDMVSYHFNERLYITGGRKILWSDDMGISWQGSSDILVSGHSVYYMYRLSVKTDDAGNTKILAAWRENWNGGVFMSSNAGASWINIERNLAHDVVTDPTRVWSQGFGWPLSASFDPNDANVMYFSDFWGAWRTDDNGLSWQERIKGAPNTIGSDIVVAPNGSLLVATMDNGLQQSTNGGLTYKALIPKANSDETAKGHMWKVLALGPTGDHIVATSSPWNFDYNQIVISEDGGQTFIKTRNGLPATYPRTNTVWDKGYARALTVDPSNHNRLYLGIDGDEGGLFISNDGGYNWSRSLGQPGVAANRIYNGLAVDPTEPSRIYWGAQGNGGGVYRSTNSGDSWSKVFTGTYYVFDLAVAQDGVVYAAGDTAGPALFASYDKGATWRKLKQFGTVGTCEAIAIDPNNARRMVVSTIKWGNDTPGKIWMSEDGGTTWSDITGDLPYGTGASAMAFSRDSAMLYLSRHAGSVYKMSLNGSAPADTLAPSAPSNLSASLSSGKVSLSWGASVDNVGVTSYKVFANNAEIGTTSASYYTHVSAVEGNTYTYNIKSFDAAGNSSASSNSVTITIDVVLPSPDTEAPNAPSALLAALSGDKPSLSWQPALDNIGVTVYKIFSGDIEIGQTAATTYLHANALAGTSYLYTVKAIDAAGNVSAASNSSGITTPSATPSESLDPPTNLTATVSNNRVILAWTNSTEPAVIGHSIYRDGVYVASMTTMSYTDSAVVAETTYIYTVKAFDIMNNKSQPSNAVTVTIGAPPPPADTECPTTPTGLTASIVTGGVQLSWANCTDNVSVAGYKVYSGTREITQTSSTSHLDTSVVAGTTYLYTVKAVDAANNISAASNAASVTIPQPVVTLPAPTNLVATVSGGKVTITWNAVVDSRVTGYNIYRDGAYKLSMTTRSYTDSSVTAGATYIYTIKAFDIKNNKSAPSNAATVVLPLKVVVLAPAVTTAVAPSATITWQTNTDAKGYVRYGLTTTFGSSSFDTLEGISHSVNLSKLVKGRTYFYQIVATNSMGTSTSAVGTFTTV